MLQTYTFFYFEAISGPRVRLVSRIIDPIIPSQRLMFHFQSVICKIQGHIKQLKNDYQY